MANEIVTYSKEKFMAEVQKYPVIYDKFSTEFKNSEIKNNAWEKISDCFGMTVNECDTKYKNIRSSYGRYLKQKKNLPSGSGRNASGSVQQYYYLEWLNTYIKHRDCHDGYEPGLLLAVA